MKLKKSKKKAQPQKQYEDHWKRAVADYQNLQKRVESERQEFAKFAAKQFIELLLPVVDDLEKASKHVKDKGLDLAIKKLHQVLQQQGVKKIDTVGKEFDLKSMEAISITQGKKENQVVSEIRPGYTMHGSVIRPAQVVVSKKN